MLQFLKNTSQINPATYFYVFGSDDIVKWYLLWLSFRGFPRLSYRGFPLVFFVNFCSSSHIVNYMKASNNHTSWTHIYRISEFFACHKIGKMWFFCLFQVNVLRFQRFLISAYWIFCYLKVMTGYKRKLDHHENYWIFGITYMHHLDHSFSSA